MDHKAGCQGSPILDLVGPFHIINVHAYLVFHMLRKVCAVRSHSSEDYASPEPPFIQKLQGLVNETDFCGHRLQFVQVDALDRDRIRSIYGIHCQTVMYFV